MIYFIIIIHIFIFDEYPYLGVPTLYFVNKIKALFEIIPMKEVLMIVEHSKPVKITKVIQTITQ